MKKVFKIMGIILIVILVIFAGLYLYWHFAIGQVLDGPGSVYEWTEYELKNQWVQINAEEPLSFEVDDAYFILPDDEKIAYSCSADTYGIPEGEVIIQLEENVYFDYFIFHEEKDDSELPILSAVKLDGQGSEDIVAEFVLENDKGEIEDGFESSAVTSRKTRE